MRISWLLLVLLTPTVGAAQPLRVVGLAPARHALDAPTTPEIVIDFDAPVDPASVDATALRVVGRWSGVMPGAVSFEDGNRRVRFRPARAFSAGEVVTVSLARRVQAAGGAALAAGFAWQFWTQPVAASLGLAETGRVPVRRPGEDWIQTYGAFAGDLDGDGFADFIVPNERSNDVRVFMHDGRGGYGTFRAYPIPGGSRPSTNEGADFDLDGDLDFVVGSSANDILTFFFGDGTGLLSAPTSYIAGSGIRGLAVLDLDGDNFPDVATANREGAPPVRRGNVALFFNDGPGAGPTPTFTRAPLLDTPGDGEAGLVAADVNEDGRLDLVVGAHGSAELLVLLSDGDGGLTLHSRTPAGGSVWMLTAGDVNGDGHIDVASANGPDDNVSIFLGDGTGQFAPPTLLQPGSFPLAIDLGDLDGDGDLDLVVSSFDAGTWTIFENPGDGQFVRVHTLQAARAASCAVLHDRDNDGTLDLTAIDELDDLLFLFTNTALPSAAAPPPEVPAAGLRAAYPNPFSTETTLRLVLDAPAAVHLDVFDLRGRLVRRLRAGRLGAGAHELTWDGRDDAGHRLAAGPYLVRLTTPTARHTRVLVFQPAR